MMVPGRWAFFLPALPWGFDLNSGSVLTRLLAVGCALLLASAVCPAQTSKKPSTMGGKTVSSHTPSHKGKKTKKRVSRRRGQQKIDGQRARAIQEALVRAHYLDGRASGVWDQKTQSAMERYQADNGWQTRVVPDSRALIKLGLGPNHDHLLNPESAMTTTPAGPVTPHSKPAPSSAPSEAPGTPTPDVPRIPENMRK